MNGPGRNAAMLATFSSLPSRARICGRKSLVRCVSAAMFTWIISASLFQSVLSERSAASEAGVVHQHVKNDAGFLQLLIKLSRRGWMGEVLGRNADGGAVTRLQLVGQFAQRTAIARHQHQTVAVVRETDAPTPARCRWRRR